MKIRYDPEADVLVIRLSSKRPDGGVDVSEGVAVLTTPAGEIVEIEIRKARSRVPATLLRKSGLIAPPTRRCELVRAADTRCANALDDDDHAGISPKRESGASFRLASRLCAA